MTPVTFGHLDIITRSAKLVDELIVGVLVNNAKSPLFSVEERVKILEKTVENIPNVKVIPFEGLLVEFVRKMEAQMVVRGLRAITDFEYELQMAQTNHKLEPELETIFLTHQPGVFLPELQHSEGSGRFRGRHLTVCASYRDRADAGKNG